MVARRITDRSFARPYTSKRKAAPIGLSPLIGQTRTRPARPAGRSIAFS
jgi:hypothetical protein